MPCLPAHWKTFTLHYRFGESLYHINVAQDGTDAAHRAPRITLDGITLDRPVIPLADDRRVHTVDISVSADSSYRSAADSTGLGNSPETASTSDA